MNRRHYVKSAKQA